MGDWLITTCVVGIGVLIINGLIGSVDFFLLINIFDWMIMRIVLQLKLMFLGVIGGDGLEIGIIVNFLVDISVISRWNILQILW